MFFNRSRTSVDPKEAKSMVDQGALLLDVREISEWNHGHAPGALNIPLGSLPQNLHRLPKDSTILVCCRSGGRSASAVSLLAENGIHAINVQGGMSAWDSHGLPVVNTKGYRGVIS